MYYYATLRRVRITIVSVEEQSFFFKYYECFYYSLKLSCIQIASFLRPVLLSSVDCLSTIASIGGTVFENK